MERHAAALVGYGVPEADFDSKVHSVFRNAAILALAPGRLVTLAPLAAGGLPGAISIDLPADFDFRQVLDSGDPAACRAGILRAGCADFTVEMRAARQWRSDLADIAANLAEKAPAEAWHEAAALLGNDGGVAGLAGLGGESVVTLIAAPTRHDGESAGKAASRLVGLGAGGTPAGDDFLVGFLAGLHASARSAERTAFVISLADRLRPLTIRTNDVSRVYLEAAFEGEVSERLTALARAIAAGDIAGTRETARAAIAVGHTSGADGTFGLLAGLAASGPDSLKAEIVALARPQAARRRT